MTDSNIRTTALHQLSPARVEQGTPISYRLIRQPDGNGNTEYVLQGLFMWQYGNERGGQWRSLPTLEFPYIEDHIPFG
jgi:hypothetical protein